MTTITIATPPTLFEFLSIEERQILVSLSKGQEELVGIGKLEGLYGAALAFDAVLESEAAIFQLLTLIHYHFLFATSCHLRCHHSEAFASARVAIDAALIAAHIITDPASQMAYVRREPPFDAFMRHLGNLIKDGKPLAHTLVPTLVKQYKLVSSFASHADVRTFIHRIQTTEQDGEITHMGVDYFQFAETEAERKYHAFALFHTFTMCLDVFADFLIAEKKAVPQKWKNELHALGGALERRGHTLEKEVRATKGGGMRKGSAAPDKA
jgi:hypothetical protein